MSILARQLRPKTFDDVVGQAHIIKLLKRLADRHKPAIFFGPPGCGKTTVARLIANTTGRKFVSLNATSAKVTEIRKLGDSAKKTEPVILFVDECLPYNTLVICKKDEKIEILPIGLIVEKRIECEVLSHNLERDICEWKSIINWSVSRPKQMVEVVVEEDGNRYSLRCSHDHLIFTKNRGYIAAGYLDDNDEVVTPIKHIKNGEHDFGKALQNMFDKI